MDLLHNTNFWVALGFILFVALVWKRAAAAITGALDGRAERIRAQLDEAAKLRSEAEAMLKAAEARQREAMQEAADMVAQAKAEAERLRIQAEQDLEATLARRQQGALEKIAQAEAAALAEVRRTAVDVAIAATRALLTSQAAGPLGDQLLDQAITELPARLN